jgi:hypothetical protein
VLRPGYNKGSLIPFLIFHFILPKKKSKLPEKSFTSKYSPLLNLTIMDHKEITNPSMGSNDLGRETSETNLTASLLAGSNTQLHIAAAGHKKRKEKKNLNDDEKVIKNQDNKEKFLQSNETDE